RATIVKLMGGSSGGFKRYASIVVDSRLVDDREPAWDWHERLLGSAGLFQFPGLEQYSGVAAQRQAFEAAGRDVPREIGAHVRAALARRSAMPLDAHGGRGVMHAMVWARQAPVSTAPLTLSDVAMPEPGPGEVRIRVGACGLCRTDLHVIEGDLPPRREPLIPGHQVVGTVDRNGPGAGRFHSGDRIGIAWLRQTCGACVHCRAGRENLCEAALFTGYHADGGYAEYAVVPEAFAYAIPPAFSDAEAAPLLCAGIIGYRALLRSEVRRGGRLGLWGFGSS